MFLIRDRPPSSAFAHTEAHRRCCNRPSGMQRTSVPHGTKQHATYDVASAFYTQQLTQERTQDASNRKGEKATSIQTCHSARRRHGMAWHGLALLCFAGILPKVARALHACVYVRVCAPLRAVVHAHRRRTEGYRAAVGAEPRWAVATVDAEERRDGR